MPTIEQVSIVQCPVGATNIPVTVTLVPNDLLVLLWTIGSGGGRNLVPSGFGSWTAQQGDAQGYPQIVQTATGLTGTGTIVATVTGSAAQATLLVVRGLQDPKIYSLAQTDGTSNPGLNVPLVGQPLMATPNQMVLGFLSVPGTSGTWTLLNASSEPSAAAWTSDALSTGSTWVHGVAHVVTANSTTPHTIAVSRDGGGSTFPRIMTLVLGEPDANALIESGTYAEAVEVNASSLAVVGSYAEMVNVSAPSQLALSGMYAEVVYTPSGVTSLIESGLYVELVEIVSSAVVRRGWGIVLN